MNEEERREHIEALHDYYLGNLTLWQSIKRDWSFTWPIILPCILLMTVSILYLIFS